MSIQQYSLEQLYNKGIIDYVPYDLCHGPNVSSLNGMQNPYLNLAQQGNLYQQYGNANDSFGYTGANSMGINSRGGFNSYGTTPIGMYGQAGMNSFGAPGIGTYGQAGANSYGESGIGYQSQLGFENSCGGFSDAKQGLANVSNKVARIPTPIKGLATLGVIIGTFAMLYKGKKVPQPKVQTEVVHNKSFLSKLNPLNWFKK